MFLDNHSEMINSLLISYGILIVFLSMASYFDIKYLKIPNKLNLSFLIVRLLLIPIIGIKLDNIYGLAFGFFIILIPAMIANKPMGGDIKSLAVIGFYLAFKKSLVFVTILIIVSFIYMIIKKYIFKDIRDVPLAPFFLISTICIIVLDITTSIS